MNNKLTATDAAIFRPHNKSLVSFFFLLHGKSVHLPLTLHLVKPSINLVKPAVQEYTDR